MALVGKRVISTWTPSLRGLLSHRHNKKIYDYQYRVSFLPYCEKAFTFESTFYNSLCLRRTDKTLSGQKRAHTSTVVFGSYHLRQESISIYHNTTQHVPYHITQPSTITGKGQHFLFLPLLYAQPNDLLLLLPSPAFLQRQSSQPSPLTFSDPPCPSDGRSKPSKDRFQIQDRLHL